LEYKRFGALACLRVNTENIEGLNLWSVD
jgi:hypothetical protein